MKVVVRRRIILLLLDLLLVWMATAAAFLLRDNLEINPDHVGALLRYATITTAIAAVVLQASGVSRGIWRFASTPDYMRLVAVATAIVGLTVIVLFSLDRMSDVARSIPILQWLLMSVALIGSRVCYRQFRARRAALKNMVVVQPLHGEAVLIVGVNQVTELYLSCVRSYAGHRINVVGLLTEMKNSAVGRTAYSIPVLGQCSQVADVLRTLEVHGVEVTQIIVTAQFSDLDATARDAIGDVEKSTTISVVYMAESFDFDRREERSSTVRGKAVSDTRIETGRDAEQARAKWPFQSAVTFETRPSNARVKRALDVVLALSLLIALAPVFIVACLLVALEIGTPVLFWQYRPGLKSRRFKLLKFRTMLAAHDHHGQRRLDDERLLPIGKFLRRTRIDELPQLFNVLRGDMSFVGPRPLLPIDQQEAPEQRLLVRPGLTGWGQINGGRLLSDRDKIALDLWYIKHRSLLLDLRIMVLTIPMIVFGDRTNRRWIDAAWRELVVSPQHDLTCPGQTAEVA